jgi:hypothetical protein
MSLIIDVHMQVQQDFVMDESFIRSFHLHSKMKIDYIESKIDTS